MDASRYYVILPDAIGTGKSSKPSDGLRARFPRYNYDDMVDAQHRRVVQSFVRGYPGARIVELADFDHECCWIERWPKILEEEHGFVTMPGYRR
jgi:homoserine O-acetyltransferase/O-succinyltransferase